MASYKIAAASGCCSTRCPCFTIDEIESLTNCRFHCDLIPHLAASAGDETLNADYYWPQLVPDRRVIPSGSSTSGCLPTSSCNGLNFSVDEILRADFGRRRLGGDDTMTSPSYVDSAMMRWCSVQTRKRQHHSGHNADSSVCRPSFDSSMLPETDTTRDLSILPSWVYCTRYTDRPAGLPKRRKMSSPSTCTSSISSHLCYDALSCRHKRRPRTNFTYAQRCRLASQFSISRYLTLSQRKTLAAQLKVTELQVKVWFQNRRAKNKKRSKPEV